MAAESRTQRHEKRAEHVADTARRFLVGINTGGIGAMLALAAALVDHAVEPRWIIAPVALFLAGIVFVVVSLLLAKHRAIKCREAAKKRQKEPDFSGFFWRSFTWDSFAATAFVLGAAVALATLSCIVIDP